MTPAFASRFLVVAAFLCALFPAESAPNITATKDDNVPAGTRRFAGDSVTYTNKITNSGSDATGVQFVDPDVAHAALVGTVKITPIAFDDAYAAVGNTLLTVNAASGLLANDIDPDNLPHVGTIVKVASVTHTGGNLTGAAGPGTLTVAADGSFTYLPGLGGTGTETFTYLITDSDGLDSVTPGTVTFTVTGRVWYVVAGGSGDGRSTTPSGSPSAMSTAANVSTDFIYIYFNASTLNGAFTLGNGVTLNGEGVALVVNSTTLRPAGSTPTIANSGGNAVTLGQNNTLAGFNVGNTSGTVLVGANVGTLSVATVGINTTGAGVDLTGVSTPTVNVVLTSLTSSGGTKNVNLVGLNGTVTLGSGALSGASGNAFDVSGAGSAVITYSGTIGNTAARAVNVASKNGGSVSFGGVVTSSGSGTGVNLTSNTGATINFTGGMSLSTGANTAFNATGGGTLNVTNGPNNTLTTTTGTALNVVSTTIGVSGLTFKSITAGTAASGPANGIFLDTTGASGALTVTGTLGSTTRDNSGGIIQKATGADGATSGHGVYLNSTSSVSLNHMNILSCQGDGIHGNSVTGFTLTYTSMATNGSTTAQLGNFHGEGDVNFVTLMGSAQVDHNDFQSAFYNTFGVFNDVTPVTLNRINMENNTFGANDIAGGNAGVVFRASGGTMNVTFGSSVATANTITGAGSNTFIMDLHGTVTSDLIMKNNAISNNHGNIVTGGGGVSLQSGGAGDQIHFTFNVDTNTFSGSHGAGFFIGTGQVTSVNTFTGSFTNNTIGIQGTANSGSTTGNDLFLDDEGGSMNITVTGNKLYQYNPNGTGALQLQVANDNGHEAQATFVVTGNTISNPGTNAPALSETFNGIQLNAGTAASDTAKTNLTLHSNTVTGSGNAALGSADIRLRQRFTATIGLFGNGSNYGGTPNDTTAIANFAVAQDGGTASAVSSSPGGFFGTVRFLMFAPGGIEKATGAALPNAAAITSEPLATAAPTVAGVQHAAGNANATLPQAAAVQGGVMPPQPSAATAPAVLTQAQLDGVVSAAIARWEATGLTKEQVARLRGVTFEVADLPGWYLGEANGNRIRVDNNAGGNGWHVDASPESDALFGTITSPTRRYTDPASAPAGRIDLLTAVLHEFGHALGLEDSYLQQDRESIMFGWLTKGERRLPAQGQAAGAQPPAEGIAHFLAAPITIGTLPAGKSVVIIYSVQIENPITPNTTTQISSRGTVHSTTASFTDVLTTDVENGVATGTGPTTFTPLGIPPTITNGPPSATATANSPYSFAYTFSGVPNPAFTNSGTLPNGLSLSGGGLLAGTPTLAGVFSGIAVTASNGVAPAATTPGFSITVSPVVTANSASLAANATTLTINGFGFSPTAANNTVAFNNGVTGTVSTATPNSLTVTGLTGLPSGSLTAIVTTNSVSSGAAVEVAVVRPSVTLDTTNLAATATTLTINGAGFSTTASNNSVSFSGGATGTVTGATATSMTITSLTGLTPGNLTAVVTSNGVSSGAAVQVATVVAGPPVSLAYGQQPTSTVAGGLISPAVTVQLLDAKGNITTSTANVSVAIGTNPGGSTLSGTPTVAAVNGTATFSGLSLDKAGAGYTLLASSGGLTGATSSGFNIAPGAASKLAFAQQPTNAAPGAAIAPPVTVQILDANNNVTASNANVTLAIGANPGSGTLSGTATVAALGGTATFSNLSINNAGNGYTLTAGSGALTGATSSTFNILSPVTHFSVSAPASATAGTSFSVTVTALDGANATVPAYTGTVHFTSSDGQAVLPPNSTLTNGTGTFAVTLKTAGAQTVSVNDTATVAITGTSASVNVAGLAVAKFGLATPPSAVAGTPFNFTVSAQDQFGNTAAGYSGTVHFTKSDIGAGSAVPLDYTFQPADNGVHAFGGGATLVTAGNRTITATDAAIGTITGTSANVLVTAGAPTHLAVNAPPNAAAGTPFSFTVTAQDGFNNTATGYTGTVHFTKSDSAAGSSVPGNYTFVVGDNGAHPFAGGATLVTAGNRTITATDTVSATITGTSGNVLVSAGAASQLAVTQQPSATATAGVAFATQPTVTLQDSFGNTEASDSTHTITVARGNHGTASLQSGPLTVTLANGVATFSGLSYNAAEAMNLGFSTDAGAFNITSNDVVVTAASASQLAITQQPSATATAGATFAAQPVVKLEDSFGNVLAADSTHTVTAARGSHGTASLQGGPLTVTLVNGVASFSGLSYNAAEVMNVSFSTDAVSAIATSNDVLVSPGAALQLVITQQPSATATAGAPFATQPVVKLADGFGNVVGTDSTHTVTVARGNHGTASLQGGPLTVTLVSGVAAFSGLSYNAAQAMNLVFTTNAGGFTATSNDVAVGSAVATHYAVTAPAAATAGTAFNTLIVTALDAFNNPATGYTGTAQFSSTDPQATLPANSALTGGSGTFPATLKTAGSQTVTAVEAGNAAINGTSGSILVAAGTDAQLAFSQQPTDTIAGVAIAPAVTVRIQDSFGNPTVSTASVTLRLGTNPGSATLGGTSVAAAVNGVATFSNLSLDKSGIGYTVNASSGSLTGAASTAFKVAPAAATHFGVSAPGSATAGVAFSNLTITALDAFNNTATGYVGTVHFTSSDVPAGLPADSTLTNGNGTFSATLKTAGNQTIKAVEAGNVTINGTSGNVLVGAAPAMRYAVSAPANATAGVAFNNLTVTAFDAFNNVAAGSAGSVHFTSSDSQAGLPADSALTTGSGSFSAVLKTAGAQTITAAEAGNGAVTGTSGNVTVAAGASAQLTFAQQPTASTAGVAISPAVTVQLQDSFGNRTADTANVTVGIGTNPTGGALAGTVSAAAVNGVASFSNLSLNKSANGYTLVASSGTLTGATSGAFNVAAAAATHFAVNAPANAAAGAAFNFTITARDAFENTAAAYAGAVAVTSTDGAAALPGNSTLTGGAGTFSATLNTGGGQTLTATDTTNGSITGASSNIAVSLNQMPTLTAISDPAQIRKNSGAQTVALSGITAGAGETQTLALTAKSGNGALIPDPSVSYTSPSGTGSLSYTPVPGQTGTALITVTVKDNGGTAGGGIDTVTRTFTITVVDVNEAPSFVVGPDQSAAQDAGPKSIANFATAISPGTAPDEAGQKLDFIVTNNQNTLFTAQPAISPTGTLTFTPAPTGSGTATVTVKLHDDGGTQNGGVDTSAPQTFQIAVTTYAEETGTYNGLVEADTGVAPGNEHVGVIRVVVAKKGLFTGSLKLADKTFPLRAHFDKAGVAMFGKPATPKLALHRTGGAPDLELSLQLDVGGGSDKLNGRITMGGAPFATIDADRALYSSAKKPVPPLTNVSPANLVGNYTVVFAAKTPADQGLPATAFPQGDGVGLLTVTSAGMVHLTGTLADGTAVSCTNALSKANRWPLYVGLSSGKGSISGFVSFRDTKSISDFDLLDMHWFQPAKRPVATHYPAAWPTGIKVDLLGSKFTRPTAASGASILPELTAVDADGNAKLDITGGGLAAPGLSKALNIGPRDKTVVLGSNPEKVSLRFYDFVPVDTSFYPVVNGHVAGSFEPAGGTTIRIYGVVFQKQKIVFGYFLGRSESGAITIAPDAHPLVP